MCQLCVIMCQCVNTAYVSISWITLNHKGRKSKSDNPDRPVSGHVALCVAIGLQGPGWGPRDRSAGHTGSENLRQRGHTSTPVSQVKPSHTTVREGQFCPGPSGGGASATAGSPAGPPLPCIQGRPGPVLRPS